MSILSRKKMIAEMARRKVQFHPNEDWSTIKLWGLFSWGSVSKYLKSGDLLAPGYTKENKTIWAYPSKELWENEIKPLTENYNIDELSKMAGW